MKFLQILTSLVGLLVLIGIANVIKTADTVDASLAIAKQINLPLYLMWFVGLGLALLMSAWKSPADKE